MTTYTLWDTESARRIGAYTDIENALDVVRRDIARGKDYLWNSGALVQLTDDDADEHIVLFEDEALIERARGTGSDTSPVSATPAPRRGSTIIDARRMDIDASAVLGSISAAHNVSSILDSLSGASEISRAANAAFLRIATVPDLSLHAFHRTDIASMYRSHAALSSLTSDIWEGLLVAQSAGLRQVAESINANALAGIMEGILAATEINRTRLVEVAVKIAQQASAAPRLGTYVLPMPDEPQVSFIFEHTEDMDILAAVAGDEESEDGDVVVSMWRVDSDTLVDLTGS